MSIDNPYLEDEAPPQQSMNNEINPYDEVLGETPPETGGFLPQWADDKLSIFNKRVENFALGGMQLLSGAVRHTAGYLPVIGDDISAGTEVFDSMITEQKQKNDQIYNEASERTPSPITSFAGDVVGSGITSAVGAGGAMIKGAGTIVQGLMGGLSASASDYSDTGQERLIKMGIGGTIGAALPMAYIGYQSAFKSILDAPGVSSTISKMFTPKTAAIDDFAHAVKLDSGNSADDALSALNKVKQSGGPQGGTIAEVMGTNSKGKVRQLEASIKVPDELQGGMAEHLGQTNVLKGQLKNTLDDMRSPEVLKAKDEAFNAMESQFLTKEGKISVNPSTDVPDVVENNSILKGLYDKIKTSELKKYQDMPDNSLRKLHLIKSHIGKQLNNAKPNKMGQTPVPFKDPEEGLLLKQAQNELNTVLKQSPEYNVAMQKSASVIRAKNYTESVNTIKPLAGNKDPTLEQVANELIPNPMKKQKFAQDVIDSGGDPVQITELLNKIDTLKYSPIWDAIRGGKYGGNLTPGDSQLGVIQKTVQNWTMKRYYKALSEVTLSGDKWVDDIANVLKQSSDKGILDSWFSLLKKAEKSIRPGVKAAIGVNVGRMFTSPPNERQKGPYGTSL